MLNFGMHRADHVLKVIFRARPHESGYFCIRNFFCCGLAFRPHVSDDLDDLPSYPEKLEQL